eukprot:gene30576-37815_t
MHDTALLIGRFEPVHSGHLALLQEALRQAPQVIVVVGSAWQARSPKNPFTWQERQAMLLGTLPEADRARVQVLPVRDYYNEAVWVQAVRAGVAERTQPGAHIALVGHFKDATSSYLRAFPGWSLIDLPRQGSMDATTIRDAYDIPASTLAQLQALAQTPHYTALQQEWRMLRGYREAWSKAPYPPVFVTVDAVLRCQNHVLLIRRAHAPGKGQLHLAAHQPFQRIRHATGQLGFLDQGDLLGRQQRLRHRIGVGPHQPARAQLDATKVTYHRGHHALQVLVPQHVQHGAPGSAAGLAIVVGG